MKDDILSKEDKEKIVKQQIEELAPKMDKVVSEIFEVLEKHKLSPLQVLIVMDSFIKGISSTFDKLEEESNETSIESPSSVVAA